MEYSFVYEKAFSRNIGWISTWEQQILRQKTVAIAGMGGVGGIHLLTLARLGIENFHIADLDYFELENFNRQVGAFMSTIGEDKTTTLKQMALDINPEINLKIFPKGVNEENLDKFLKDVDIYVDGLDAFVLEIRRKIFAYCHKHNIPAITAGPLGWGAAYMIFSPDGMSFEEYFQLKDLPPEKQYVNFLFGLGAAGLHRSYIMDPYQLNLHAKKGPSTSPSCQLCSGVSGVQVAKLLLKRGRVYPAPWCHQFDPYKEKLVRRYIRGGNKNILQQLRLQLAYKFAKKLSDKAINFPKINTDLSELEQILDYARWSPSGDNSQPWSFKIVNNSQINIDINKGNGFYGTIRNNHGIYLTAGFLVKTLQIAATKFSRRITWEFAKNQKNGEINLIINLFKDNKVETDPLVNFIIVRSVNRKAYKKTPLSNEDKKILEETLNNNLEIQWFESNKEKDIFSRLNAITTNIRLQIPETFSEHAKIIDFKNDYSPDLMPVNTISSSIITKMMTIWALKNKKRMYFLGKIPNFALFTQIESDIIPGKNCAAHYVISSKKKNKDMKEKDRHKFLIESGMSLQKFWLTATKLGIAMQPSLITAFFYMQGMENKPFSVDKRSLPQAKKLAKLLHCLLKFPKTEKDQPHDLIFMGRVGYPKTMKAQPRSLRKDLASLIKS